MRVCKDDDRKRYKISTSTLEAAKAGGCLTCFLLQPRSHSQDCVVCMKKLSSMVSSIYLERGTGFQFFLTSSGRIMAIDREFFCIDFWPIGKTSPMEVSGETGLNLEWAAAAIIWD